MNKQRGFTLVEMLVTLMIAMTALSIIVFGVQFAMSSKDHNATISYGINGMTEMRCIDGYRFIISSNGTTRQVMDELGHGVKCTSM